MAFHTHSPALRRQRCALAALALGAAGAHAQQGAAAATPDSQTVQITGRAPAGVAGLDAPLARTPLQVDVVGAGTLADLGAANLADLVRLDASIGDAYNAQGYWTFFTLRGFVIDNRSNFRRDGLPINAETALPLGNKAAVEVLKGLSGTQAGVSAPGGLVNLVVKRPDGDLRSASIHAEQGGSVGAAIDLSQRFGTERAFGARLNVGIDSLDPQTRDDRGHRHLVALAVDWRIDGRHALEIELEHSLQSQPSVPGFSLLGSQVPDARTIDPRINLNDQPWSLPVVLRGDTASIRWTQAIDARWRLQLHAGRQSLVSNDRIAFPYGLYDPATYACAPCDRYSSDGRFTLWDFQSDNERRRSDAVDLSATGELGDDAHRHTLTLGVLDANFRGRFGEQIFDIVGDGTIDGRTVVPLKPLATSPNTDRDQRSLELYLRDRVDLAPGWTAWAGLRHTRLHSQSMQTSGDPQATDARQSFTTPWLSLSHALTTADMVYVSWGEGVETHVVPNLPTYANAGQALPAALSRQWEVGLKHAEGTSHWGLSAYDIRQPQTSDIDQAGDGSGNGTLLRVEDGIVHARGIEAEAQAEAGALTLRASASWQRLRREGALQASQNGLRPTNAPGQAIKLLATWNIATLPGLALLANLDHEGRRDALPDNSVSIPGWTRLDLGARFTQTLAGTTCIWRAGLDNATDHRAWRESPYQYGHAYLFPLAPRTWRMSLEAVL